MIEYWLGNMYLILGMNLGMITAIAIALAYDTTQKEDKTNGRN